MFVNCNAPPMMKVNAINKTIVLLINDFIVSLKKMIYGIYFSDKDIEKGNEEAMVS
jgi:hypothetical protein